MLGYWGTGTMGYWDTGTLGHWDTGKLGYWDTTAKDGQADRLTSRESSDRKSDWRDRDSFKGKPFRKGNSYHEFSSQFGMTNAQFRFFLTRTRTWTWPEKNDLSPLHSTQFHPNPPLPLNWESEIRGRRRRRCRRRRCEDVDYLHS